MESSSGCLRRESAEDQPGGLLPDRNHSLDRQGRRATRNAQLDIDRRRKFALRDDHRSLCWQFGRDGSERELQVSEGGRPGVE
jgi:hypothetical protein